MQCSVSAGATLSPPHLNIITLHNVQLNTLQLSELVRHDSQLSISEILRLLRAGGETRTQQMVTQTDTVVEAHSE